MLSMQRLREHPEEVRQALVNRNEDPGLLERVLELDAERREVLGTAEGLKAERNRVSALIGKLRTQPTGAPEAAALQQQMRHVADQIKGYDQRVQAVEQQLEDVLLRIPNVPHASVPVGPDASANVVVRTWGDLPRQDVTPKPHWELGEQLGILDLPGAARLSGSMFAAYRGAGARLVRALIQWFLDYHVTHQGYTEVWLPFIVRREAMVGSAQFPKFEQEGNAYHIEQDDMFLIPTSEVTLVNMFADTMLDAAQLPIAVTTYSPCFRREAGAAGRETRGLLRLHQFEKVEMVKVCTPENSYDELERLVQDAEQLLQLLGLPYRVVLLSTGDMGFAAAKTYDLEVWAAGQGRWLEASSCSNCEDFQARRAQIRFRRAPRARPEYCHLLNGSGLALPRVYAALLENHQQADGSVAVPEVLRSYMGGLERITAAQAGQRS
jgi:seryl-tRNA synthetase